MRTIKFRGRDKETGKLVYGSFVDYGEDCNSRYWINPIGNERNHPVDPNSVAQLIGVDVDGNEIYEGDRVVDVNDGFEFTAYQLTNNVNPCYVRVKKENDK